MGWLDSCSLGVCPMSHEPFLLSLSTVGVIHVEIGKPCDLGDAVRSMSAKDLADSPLGEGLAPMGSPAGRSPDAALAGCWWGETGVRWGSTPRSMMCEVAARLDVWRARTTRSHGFVVGCR